MRKVIIGLALALVASSAMAGTLLEPVMEHDVIVQQAASSGVSHMIIPPLFFLLFVGLGLVL